MKSKELNNSISVHWCPSKETIETLKKEGINPAFIEDAIPEFVLYCRERGSAGGALNTRFIEHIQTQWNKYATSFLNNDASEARNNTPDHVDAINQLFASFELAYHNQYHKAYGTDERLVLAKKFWLNCLSDFSPIQIVAAARRVMKSNEYLPTVSVIVRACEEGGALFGLPTSRQAYYEACSAPAPKAVYAWSHPAVYHAGKQSGWYVLANEPEDKAFPLFDYIYHQLCQRVMKGESLDTPQTPALPERISRKLTPEENQARMVKMRSDLGL